MKNNKFIVVFLFALLILPRYIDNMLGKYSIIIDLLKLLLLSVFAIRYFFKRKTKDKLLNGLIMYSIYIVLTTFFNKESLLFVLNTYVTGVLSFLFIKIIAESDNRNNYFKSFIKVLNVLLSINLIIIIYNLITKGSVFIDLDYSSRFFLSSDNRFILYILIQTILYNILVYEVNDRKKLKKQMVISYLINLITLFLVWSVAALVIYVIIIILQITLVKRKKPIHLKTIFAIIIVIELLIVFFNFQNVFKHFIVDILHKSTHLSYRTFIWDKAIHEITSKTNYILFGHGFINLTTRFILYTRNVYGVPMALSPIHLHNLLLNNLYMGGIIGTLLYSFFIYGVMNRIELLKNSNIKLYNILSIIIVSIITLLIFDVFELYSQYFIILSLLSYSYINLNKVGDEQ